MSAVTKTAIQHEFGELLKKKQLKQVTVRELCDKVGIARNTFYYHYNDVYDLAEDYFRVRVERIISEYPSTGEQWAEGLKTLLVFFQNNKVIAMNIYHSLDYTFLQNVIFNALKDYSKVYIERKCENNRLAEEDIKNISEFITYAITGTIMRWAEGGMEGDVEAQIDKYLKLFGPTLNFIAENAASLL